MTEVPEETDPRRSLVMTPPCRLIASPIPRLHDGREIRLKDGDGDGERSRSGDDLIVCMLD